MGVTGVRDVRELEERKRVREEKEKARKALETPKKKALEGVKGIVRVAETNLDGTKKVRNIILNIKGIGKSLAIAIPRAAGIDPEARLGSLTDAEIEHLEVVMRDPAKFGIPSTSLDKPKEQFSGSTFHLIASDLEFSKKSDIDFMKKIRCYKGVRHELGLPVRGQRTRSSFRTGMIVGVARKAAKIAAKETEKKPGKPGEAKVEAKPAEAKAAPSTKAAPAKPEAKKEEKK